MDLAAQVLEEALELLDRAIGGGKELGGVERPGFEPANVIELRRQLAPEALELAAGEHRVSAFEAQADPIGLAEDPSGKRAGAVAQLNREVGAPVSSRQPVLAHAGVVALEPLTGAQLGDCGLSLLPV